MDTKVKLWPFFPLAVKFSVESSQDQQDDVSNLVCVEAPVCSPKYETGCQLAYLTCFCTLHLYNCLSPKLIVIDELNVF